MNLSEKEQIEISFWKDNALEGPEHFTKENMLNKMQECRILDYKLSKYKTYFSGEKRVLEIGAGQGWSSCFIKKHFMPDAHFTVTDISPYALESIKYWEELFEVEIGRTQACRAYETPFNDEEFDLIFCFASFHHFVKYETCLKELKRTLKPKGDIIFLYEPTSSALFYKMANSYVNKMPHSTPEDVIIPSKLRVITNRLGLKYSVEYDTAQVILRSFGKAAYFKFLDKLPFLQPILPASASMIFSKK